MQRQSRRACTVVKIVRRITEVYGQGQNSAFNRTKLSTIEKSILAAGLWCAAIISSLIKPLKLLPLKHYLNDPYVITVPEFDSKVSCLFKNTVSLKMHLGELLRNER
jgi:hypothetical protein